MEVVDGRTLIEIGNNSFITEKDTINISELIQIERREPDETSGVSSIELGLDKKYIYIFILVQKIGKFRRSKAGWIVSKMFSFLLWMIKTKHMIGLNY